VNRPLDVSVSVALLLLLAGGLVAFSFASESGARVFLLILAACIGLFAIRRLTWAFIEVRYKHSSLSDKSPWSRRYSDRTP
jgi:hypothetical protein